MSKSKFVRSLQFNKLSPNGKKYAVWTVIGIVIAVFILFAYNGRKHKQLPSSPIAVQQAEGPPANPDLMDKTALAEQRRQMEQMQKRQPLTKETPISNGGYGQSMISVSVEKLDKLMNLVGEMVISEAMVTQNPDLKGLVLDNFNKSARQLRKITNELQDMVMSIRMVPLGPTFFKMNRIVRDISKLGKDITLNIMGEETEVDKNIIRQIGDPLMHIVRNSADHGIEVAETRISQGKPGLAPSLWKQTLAVRC